MNKEELLKEIMKLPKIETVNPISTMNSINVDDLMNAVDRLNKVPDYNDLLKENQELKKQVEEWEHHLKCSKEMLEIQGQKGNYDYDEYMLGLYNGMEYIISLFETREPNYISGKDVEFTNNRTQQKEFIKYLENEIKRINPKELYISELNLRLDDIKFTQYLIYKEILQKYKEVIGDDK